MTVIELIKSDLYRYHGKSGLKYFLSQYFKNKGFYFTFWFRLTHRFYKIPILGLLLKYKYSKIKTKLVTDINFRAHIGPGFCVYHLFGTTFSDQLKIGKNFVLMHGVTLGGSDSGYPSLGDNVFVGPNALVIGKINIGNDVAIGGNSVVTKSLEYNSVFVGNPGRIVSSKGSRNYVRNRV